MTGNLTQFDVFTDILTMKVIVLIVSIFLSQQVLANFEPFVPAWAQKCETKLTNKNMLYEVYHDCMDICMLKSPMHRKLITKKRQKICTNFTARYLNRQVNQGSLDQRVNIGTKFCGDQRIHRTGGHWLYISRQCKRIICDYNTQKQAEKHPLCKKLNQYLNNGQIVEVYQPLTPSDKQRRGTVPNTLLKEGEKSSLEDEVEKAAQEAPAVSETSDVEVSTPK